ncbi:glycosyltransferase family 4 protein [Planctomycetales bacterium ZRK34]|nr:glycosyltransferase family 4 protein [Planctomycetales bacterium ZRK34]
MISHAAAAMRAAGWRCVVIVGEAPRVPVDFDVRVIDALRYDVDQTSPVGAAALSRAIRDAAGKVDLYHIHNHSLGKAAALPGAARSLAAEGHRLVLQPHDFAEDGRPANYRHLSHAGALRDLYPVADHIHYATLNSRDRSALVEAGLDPVRIRTLPNAIDLPIDDSDPPHQHGRLFLYPTRAIRRKNMGEMLLWAAASRKAHPEARFAATLAPTSAVDIPIYEDWKRLAASLNLPAEFEVGSNCDASFTALLRSAHALMTTSVAEGFGLAFLEPMLLGQRLVGRDLPDISADFKADDIDLSSLYARLDVPLSWVSAETLREHIATKLHASLEAYGQPCEAAHVDAALHAAAPGDTVDFGRLDESLQRRVIERLAADDAACSQLEPDWLDVDLDPSRLANNQRLVAERYNLQTYGQRLMSLYQCVLDAPVSSVDALEPRRVLDQFLAPERFFLLRT